MSEEMSALRETESRLLLPNTIFPSKVTLPVTCTAPVTSVLVNNFISPAPAGVKSISSFDLKDLMPSASIDIPSVFMPPAIIVAPC